MAAHRVGFVYAVTVGPGPLNFSTCDALAAANKGGDKANPDARLKARPRHAPAYEDLKAKGKAYRRARQEHPDRARGR